MESNDIRMTEDAGVLTVTFTRDAKLNAVSPDMIDVLRDAATQLEDRYDLRVLLITGEGRYFTAGIDIAHLKGRAPDEDGKVRTSSIRRERRKLHRLFDQLESIEKPVVLAAQGPCLGFGMEMACSVDFRLASERTNFGLPEVVNLAVLPGAGGINRFTRLVGPHWSRYVNMANKRIDAHLARQIGFVHEVYADDEFAERARQFCRDLVALPGEAIGLAKIAIEAAASMTDRAAARDVDRIANSLLLTTDEHAEALARFRAK